MMEIRQFFIGELAGFVEQIKVPDWISLVKNKHIVGH